MVLFLALLALPALPAAAQPSPTTPGQAEELLRVWNEIGQKLIVMAEDFPESKYDYRPTPEVRTFAEQLLHVAGSTYFFIQIAKGEKPSEEDLPREKYKTKAEVVTAVKKSVETGAAFIRESRDAGLAKPAKLPWSDRPINQGGLWMDAIEHAGEHYGNLVVYYRLNGIVPPASRQSGN